MLPIEIEVENVKSLIDSDEDFLLVDCRESMEREIALIKGAVHIPVGETVERQSEMEPYREKRIVILCHHGVRSLQVTHYLRSQGFEMAQNMTGGIDQWSDDIDTTLAKY